MNRYIKTAALITAAALLCGCSQIPDRTEIAETVEVQETAETAEELHYDELSAKEYEIDKTDVLLKLNAEGGVFEGSVRTDGEYDGQGYIILDEGMSLTHIADVPSAQHYRIILAVHSYGGAVLKFAVRNQTEGVYYIPPSSSAEYEFFAIDNLYLIHGPSILTFTVESGSAAIDYIMVENSDHVDSSCYRTASTSVSSNSPVSVIGAMKYLTDIYGNSVITGQNVTPGTNAEIEVIYEETGRYPAMRCGEIALSLLSDEESAVKAETELQLGLEWGEKGGLVSYTWHWYSPDRSRAALSEATEFSLSDVLNGQSLEQLALAGTEELEALYTNGFVSDNMYALLKDIDAIAEGLKPFADADIPVIWQPLPDGDSSLYWWGGDSESFKQLWQIVFERMDTLHGLSNLIWVWNGSSPEFYPGDKYCDIIGQSFFENSPSSFAGRFSALAKTSDTEVKPLAITSCDRLPKPDYMLRDNAMWLWFAIGSGDCIMNTDGTLSEAHTDWQSLHDAYNSKLCLTLDELPDFTKYAFSG